MVKGMPVFYHFGPGAKVDEYKKVLSLAKLPQGMKQPVALRRWADWENWKMINISPSLVAMKWIPGKKWEKYELHISCPCPYKRSGTCRMDNYATQDDVIEFMKPFRDSIWHSNNPAYTIKSGFAMPRMDNRGCAGWGRGHFYYIPRNNGETYQSMWKFCMAEKDSLDMMFYRFVE